MMVFSWAVLACIVVVASCEAVSREEELVNAASSNNVEQVRSLLNAGVSVEARNPTGSTPLHAASFAGYTDVMAILLDEGANIEARDVGSMSTAMHVAAFGGRVEAIRLLVDRGANKELKNAHGGSPLAVASFAGRNEVVRLLIDQGADLRSRDNFGSTPLTAANYAGYTETAKLIKDRGGRT